MDWEAFSTDQEAFEAAVREFWVVRNKQGRKNAKSRRKDTGQRGTATGGAHMDALAKVISRVFVDAGFTASSSERSLTVDLPGHYRPTKEWDVVISHGDALIAAIELKSHVGPSFSNNYNNRTEEAIGSALDIKRSYERGQLGTSMPWLGYVMLLERHHDSTKPVQVDEPLYKVDPLFWGASYKGRYELLCRRLVEDRLYDAACFFTTSPDPLSSICEPAADLSFKAFADAIRALARRVRPEDLPGQMSLGWRPPGL
jgi:hypothetical protein